MRKSHISLPIAALLLILAACSSGSKTVSVSIASPNPLNLVVGSQVQLSANVSGSSNIAVTWSSSNPGVASISTTGLLSAQAPGSTVITAQSVADSSQKATLSVNVQPASTGGTNSISGTVSVGAAASSLAQSEFVPGELIVKFRSGVSLQSVQTLSAGGIQLQQVRPLSLANTYLYRTTPTREAVLQCLNELQGRSDVEYAQPNFILRPQATPNDPRFPDQWNLPAINVPAAWDLTKGSASVVVAVLDTGIVSSHEDLSSKLVPGYNFISDSNNGGPRGPNPEDTDTGGEFHGTHVAGIIGAATNNAKGIAAVGWNTRILPVRVISANGGTTADIIDGLRWAAGLAVSGVPNNPNPAAILNLSLGGPGRCSDSPALQSAINDALGQGAILTVAAGNSSVDATTFTPASCSGVITVGATDRNGNRASYSNTGPRIDLMAPGGDASNGILSTINNNSYGFLAGTSQAAPHVAGVIALMKAIKPSLGAGEALSILKSTAKAIGSCGGNCGAGLIDAGAALNQLSPPTPQKGLALSASPSAVTLTLGNSASVSVSLSIIRTNFSDPVTLSLSGVPSGLSATLSSSSVSGNNATLTLGLSGSPASGAYSLTISGSGGGVSASTTVVVNVVPATPSPARDIQGTKIYFDAVTSQTPLTITPDFNPLGIGQSGLAAPYRRDNLDSGVIGYRVSAWKDVNGNGQQDAGDLFAWYTVNGNIATVPVGSQNINLQLQPILSTTYTRDQMLREIREKGHPSR
ncbi:S8 family serine peptidase [Meiothermus granaticius]|uniref:S8 family serine peptidase n=1 Tax=Meiothermus granaticius TaxID=863370 RepID=UPI0011BE857B|nr:S8 family serine peptidase [Meiothermus granaticius]